MKYIIIIWIFLALRLTYQIKQAELDVENEKYNLETIDQSWIVFAKVYIPVSDPYKEKFQDYLNKNFL